MSNMMNSNELFAFCYVDSNYVSWDTTFAILCHVTPW